MWEAFTGPNRRWGGDGRLLPGGADVGSFGKNMSQQTRGQLRVRDVRNLCTGGPNCALNSGPLPSADARHRLATIDYTHNELARWFAVVDAKCCDCKEPSLKDLQFTEKDVVLWRDRKNPMHRARTSKFMKNSFGPKWGKILSHFSGFLPDGVFNRIRAILLRFTACCETCWIKNLKALSARAIS